MESVRRSARRASTAGNESGDTPLNSDRLHTRATFMVSPAGMRSHARGGVEPPSPELENEDHPIDAGSAFCSTSAGRSASHASGDTGRRMLMMGDSMRLRNSKRPIMKPSGIPTTAAAPKPMPTPVQRVEDIPAYALVVGAVVIERMGKQFHRRNARFRTGREWICRCWRPVPQRDDNSMPSKGGMAFLNSVSVPSMRRLPDSVSKIRRAAVSGRCRRLGRQGRYPRLTGCGSNLRVLH